MRKIRTEDAVGQALCHDITAIRDGKQGPLFRRGHIVRAEDVQAMLDIGKFHVFVWEPEADEVHEEDAARALTGRIAGPNIAYTGPSQGKFVLTSKIRGLYKVNREGLLAINRVQDFTVASIPGNTPVEAGGVLAGVRIVPLVTARGNVEEAVRLAGEFAPVLCVKPYLPLKVGVVITGGEIFHGRIPDAFEPMLRKKLGPFGAQLLGFVKCPDELEPILAAARGFLDAGAELVLFTGGMSVDPDDLTPTAIRLLGAEFLTQGMAAQPGNMLTIAYAEDTPLIGIPSAAIHSPTTSLDLFLPRILAGERIGVQDTKDLGEGGLCLNCPVCRYPVCYFGRK